MKKRIIYIAAVAVVIVAAFFAWRYWEAKKVQNASPAGDNSSIILFFGQECPHCKIVEQYLADNNVRSQISFSEREVYHNPANAKLMLDKQKACGLDKSYVGAVPFLWTKDKCYVGQDDIIQFFKDQLLK